MPEPWIVEAIGALAAALTTLGWLPQALKIIRERRTDGVSLATHLMIASGLLLWLVYGLLRASPPLVVANAVTLALVSVIVIMKLRLG